MYTANITSKSIQRAAKLIVIDVAFQKDQEQPFVEKMSFSLGVTFDQIKAAIYSRIKNLEEADANIGTITEGVVDLTGAGNEPTPAQIAKAEWFRDFNRLERVQKLVDLGVFPADKQTALDALKAKVESGFKAAYVNEM